MDRDWRRLWSSPADRNEFNELELPRASEPLDSLRSLPNGKGKETHLGFPHGNQTLTK